MKDIDGLLAKYQPGDPSMKPDVIKQTQEIEIQRKKMEQENIPQIFMQQPGKEPIALTPQDLVNIVRQQQTEIQNLQSQNQDMQRIIMELQQKNMSDNNKIIELQSIIMELQKQLISKSTVRTKSEPEIEITL